MVRYCRDLKNLLVHRVCRLGLLGLSHDFESFLAVLAKACITSFCGRLRFTAVELIAFVATKYVKEKWDFIAGNFNSEVVTS